MVPPDDIDCHIGKHRKSDEEEAFYREFKRRRESIPLIRSKTKFAQSRNGIELMHTNRIIEFLDDNDLFESGERVQKGP